MEETSVEEENREGMVVISLARREENMIRGEKMMPTMSILQAL